MKVSEAIKDLMTIEALKEMMDNWSKIEKIAKEQMPFASNDEIYLVCKTVMDQSLGLE